MRASSLWCWAGQPLVSGASERGALVTRDSYSTVLSTRPRRVLPYAAILCAPLGGGVCANVAADVSSPPPVSRLEPVAASDSTFDSFAEDDIPVVLSASRLRQPLTESPVAITVIPRDMIIASGARSIVDILRLVPGMVIGRRTNGNPVAAYGGITDRYNPRLQLLIDGRPSYIPIYGGIPWGELPISIHDIERVEVTRGPNAATYGPNSYQGVVSITTAAPEALAGTSVHASAGGNRARSGTLRHSTGAGPLDFRVTLQAENDEGYRNLPDRERDRLIDTLSHWQVNADDRLSLGLGGVTGERVEFDPVEIPEQFAPIQSTSNAYLQLAWERSRSVDDELTVRYHYDRYAIREDNEFTIDLIELSENEVLELPPFGVEVNRDVTSERHEFELQKTTPIGSSLRTVVGAAVRQDRVSGQYLFGDNETRSIDTQRVFAHGEYRVHDQWIINTGGLFDHTSLSGSSFAPRASVLFKPRPDDVFRLSYSRGSRAPLLLEEEGSISLDYDFSGQTVTDIFLIDGGTIDYETIDVVDLSWNRNFPETGLFVDTRLAYHRINDLLGTRRIPFDEDEFDQEARIFENRFDYSYSSAELQLDWKTRNAYHFRLAWSRAFGEDSILSARDLVPGHTLSMFASYRYGRASLLSAEYYRTGEWIWDDVRDRSKLERFDVRAARELQFGRSTWTLAVQGEFFIGDNLDYLERNEVENRYFAEVSVELY